jgi:hypothetical protein
MSQGDIETATIFTRAMRGIQGKFSGVVSDISGKADISGQTFTGDIAAPKITASTGVLFGTDTAAANTLDDYEEGTWTPEIKFDGDNVGASGAFYGVYTKIGRMVTVNCNLRLTSKGTSKGSVAIVGLPFSVSNLLQDTTIEASSVASYWASLASPVYNISVAAQSPNQLILLPITVATTTSSIMDDTFFSNDTNIRLSCTYFTL